MKLFWTPSHRTQVRMTKMFKQICKELEIEAKKKDWLKMAINKKFTILIQSSQYSSNFTYLLASHFLFEFHMDWQDIVDFLVKVKVLASLSFLYQSLEFICFRVYEV